MTRTASRIVAGGLLAAGATALAGCQRAPTIDVLGSFFPAWLLCLVLGIALAAGTRFALSAAHLEKVLSPPILMYACLTALFTFGLWLIFFH